MLKKRILLMALTAALLAVSLAAPVHALSRLAVSYTHLDVYKRQLLWLLVVVPI